MKRLLTFKFIDPEYVIQENTETIFSIDPSTLKFDSLLFYNGIYRDYDETVFIELKDGLINDPFQKGSYIFKWLNEIVSAINLEFAVENPSSEKELFRKTIPLFEMATCAGNGQYDVSDAIQTDFEVDNKDADYALRVVGRSMEPKIPDGSIVVVKQQEELANNDAGIFVVDGESMCKRYIVRGKKAFLVPDNKSDEFHEVEYKPNDGARIQGKVIAVLPPHFEFNTATNLA